MSITLRAKRVGIDTYHEPTIFLHRECTISRAQGFEVQSRVLVKSKKAEYVAKISIVTLPTLNACEAGLSDMLWADLQLDEGEDITVSYPAPLYSFSHVRAKIFGKTLSQDAMHDIIRDVTAQRYSGVEIAAFLTACSGDRLNHDEIISLTHAMVDSGKKIDWGSAIVLDKHCIGGLPGNRTTPIVVAIIAANGLMIPKTSSRAITSSAGTADMMEVLAPVDLSLEEMRKVVQKESGCLVWGGRAELSPADDALIRIERLLGLDNEGQLIASVLSKKIAAGSKQILIDIPVGATTKMRNMEKAQTFSRLFVAIGTALGLNIATHISNEEAPVGRGIGPALEARDVIAVLKDQPDAPADLRERALTLAGKLLSLATGFTPDKAMMVARETLESGRAWQKFQAICEAQGGMHAIPQARLTHPVLSTKQGKLTRWDNRKLAQAAKFAGAPHDKAAGLDLHVRLGETVHNQQPLFTLHAETKGEMEYAIQYVDTNTLFDIG